MAALIFFRKLLLCLVAAAFAAPCIPADGVTATEQQVKAVFVYNFSHFVDWPNTAFAADADPFVIGVVGGDAFAVLLEDVVRGERVGDHPIQVRRFSASEAIGSVHILFVDRSGGAQLERAVAANGRGTLTVSDMDNATQHGAMIQLANINNRIRLRINVESARSAGLLLNSNLLRQAEIVRSGNRD
ncbi:MAG: YfiR family protein [Pseudomonadota bacterium]